MSGNEVAGVVLAVIPILRITLQQFDGERFKTLLKYDEMIRRITRKLDLQHAQFHSTCERLLSPLVDEDKLAELLENPKASTWNDQELEDDMKEHLGRKKYDLYIATVKDLAISIISLQDDLGLADMSANSEKWFERASKRLKTSMKHKKHVRRLEEIKECNETLHRLVGDVLEMTPIRTNRQSKLDAKKWESLRRLAESLHSTLECELACNCGHCHRAHLRLESRSDQETLDVCFSVLFSLDSGPIGWQETKIVIVRSETNLPSPSPPKSDSGPSRVKWAGLADDAVDNPEVRAGSPSNADSRIEDLCQELRKQRQQAECIGFLDDGLQREYHIHSVYPPTTLGDDLSLAQLLSRKESEGIPSLLGRDKYELAVILATSVLQLHGTPWMEDSNWKEDVRFVRAKEMKQPFAYIQKKFGGQVRQVATNRRGSMTSVIRNETIFALGVTLIELSLGKGLRSFQTADDLGPDGEPNFLTDLSIAQRLVTEEVQSKEGARYANTINRCIHCLFDGIDPSLENEQFRQAFYHSAVAPLKEIRDDFIK